MFIYAIYLTPSDCDADDVEFVTQTTFTRCQLGRVLGFDRDRDLTSPP